MKDRPTGGPWSRVAFIVILCIAGVSFVYGFITTPIVFGDVRKARYPPSVSQVAPAYAVDSLSVEDRLKTLEARVKDLQDKDEQLEGWISSIWTKVGM